MKIKCEMRHAYGFSPVWNMHLAYFGILSSLLLTKNGEGERLIITCAMRHAHGFSPTWNQYLEYFESLDSLLLKKVKEKFKKCPKRKREKLQFFTIYNFSHCKIYNFTPTIQFYNAAWCWFQHSNTSHS